MSQLPLYTVLYSKTVKILTQPIKSEAMLWWNGGWYRHCTFPTSLEISYNISLNQAVIYVVDLQLYSGC